MLTVTKKHVFFFTEWPSNFKVAPFECNITGTENHNFFCTEQAFMYAKAITFNDYNTAKKILDCKTPQEAKNLGREVFPYFDDIWSKVRYDYMFKVNLNKYQQNPDLLKLLLDPQFDNKTFVEASPWDTIWGIALSRKEYDIDYIDDEHNWKGQNLLGIAITNVRRHLINNNYCINFDCFKNDHKGLCGRSKNEYCMKNNNYIQNTDNLSEVDKLKNIIKDILQEYSAGCIVGDTIRSIVKKNNCNIV